LCTSSFEAKDFRQPAINLAGTDFTIQLWRLPCVCVYKLKPNFNGSFLLLSMLFFSLSHTHRHFRVLWFVWSSVVKKEKKQRGVEQPTTSLL
jgi:hypothetical protein